MNLNRFLRIAQLPIEDILYILLIVQLTMILIYLQIPILMPIMPDPFHFDPDPDQKKIQILWYFFSPIKNILLPIIFFYYLCALSKCFFFFLYFQFDILERILPGGRNETNPINQSKTENPLMLRGVVWQGKYKQQYRVIKI